MESTGQALFAFVRFWSRRWTGAEAHRGRDVMVVEAVHAAEGHVSINDIARELGVDQSGASRMVAHAEKQGLVTRQSSGRVGTVSTVATTPSGEALLREAHAWQDNVMRTLTANWPAEDVRTLTTLMDRLVRAQADLDAAGRQAATSDRTPESNTE